MKLALLEVVSAGFYGTDITGSWLREGLAMWRAVTTDIAAVPGIEVDTLLGHPWQERQPVLPNVRVRITDPPPAAGFSWVSALKDADAVLIIAPESDGLLGKMVSADPRPLPSWNCTAAAIELCSDKWRLHNALAGAGIPTIPSVLEHWETAPVSGEYPCVVKPFDGAGSYLVHRVNQREEWDIAKDEFEKSEVSQALRQPFIPGRSLSIAGWFADDYVDWLPIAEQHLSQDGQFQYQGGTIPARLEEPTRRAVQQLASTVARQISGLRGYVGMDILCPDDDPTAPLLVEMNPRFTTSYVGYREWWHESPWPRWLSQASGSSPAITGRGCVTFTAAGEVSMEEGE